MPAMSNIIVFFHGPKYILTMERLKAFKFELQPNGEHIRDMQRFAGSCRLFCVIISYAEEKKSQ